MRSKLFVPGSRPELLAKAMASAADGLSLDLEDAVAEPQKDTARSEVVRFLESLTGRPRQTVIVRVNGDTTPHHEADVMAVARPGLDWLNLPKVEHPEQVSRAVALLERAEAANGVTTPIRLLATIESPAGLRRAHRIAAAHPRMVGLQLGLVDLLEPLGMQRSPELLAQLRTAMRLAAGEAGIAAWDAAFVDVADREGFRRDARAAAALGYAGKSCIHPAQIADANEIFELPLSAVHEALAVVRAAREADGRGVGAFMLAGRMVDLPIIRRAEAVVAAARAQGRIGDDADG